MKKILLSLALTTLLIVSACGDSPAASNPVMPHDPVDQGWKAVQNFEYSFQSKDLALLEATLSSDFTFQIPEEDWADYDGDGIVDTKMSKTLFMQVITQLFNDMEVIELNHTGDDESVWPGDPTGATMQYPRSYVMKAYNWVGGVQEGWTREGVTSFLCRANQSGTWQVTQIMDPTGL